MTPLVQSCVMRQLPNKNGVFIAASIALILCNCANCWAFNPCHLPQLEVQGIRCAGEVSDDLNQPPQICASPQYSLHSVLRSTLSSIVFMATLVHHSPAASADNDTTSYVISSTNVQRFVSSQQSIEATYRNFMYQKSDDHIRSESMTNTIGTSFPVQKKAPSMIPLRKQRPSNMPSKSPPKKKKELQVINLQKLAELRSLDVELIDEEDQRPLDASAPILKIDTNTFTKVVIYQPPSFLQYLPSSVQPLVSKQFQSWKVLKSIPNDQLFLASVIAGSLTEIIRTVLLFPLSTVKSRVQARKSKSRRLRRRPLKQLRLTWLTFLHETKRGQWYAGLLPSLLLAVPASGMYSGTKEVSRRGFTMILQLQAFQNMLGNQDDPATALYYSSLIVNLLSAFCADIASLALRTPADVLSIRLQVFGRRNVRSDFGEWAQDSVILLPALVVTDIPFLLSRIFLNAAITTSGENLGQYELETIFIACLCAFLTTPFDVARTRILLPKLSSENEMDRSSPSQNRRLVKSSESRVSAVMRKVVAEGNGGVQNLYAGWLERTLFLGIGRAWLDPIRVIGYMGIRDAILLKLFD